MIRKLFVCCTMLLIAACTPTEPDETQLRLNMARWDARAESSYQVVVQRADCECLAEWMIPVLVTVRDGEIESVVHAQTGEPAREDLYHTMTVDDLFAVIEDALARNAYRMSVRYDDDAGYPRSIYIDYDREMVDDELSLTAEVLRPTD